MTVIIEEMTIQTKLVDETKVEDENARRMSELEEEILALKRKLIRIKLTER